MNLEMPHIVTLAIYFQTSRLRPDVEPFVPKSQNGQPYYVMGNGGFSLDAPEFIPNVYASNGEMYTWVPNQVLKKCEYILLVLYWNSVYFIL